MSVRKPELRVDTRLASGKMVECKDIIEMLAVEDQIKEAFKEGVIYGNGLLQTFDYPESRYYYFTYGYSKKR